MILRLTIAALQGAICGFGLGALLVAFFLVEGSAQVSLSAILTITSGTAGAGLLMMVACELERVLP